MDILHAFVLSLYSDRFYRHVALSWREKSFVFTALLTILVVLLFFLISGSRVREQSLYAVDQALDQVPEMHVKNGVLTVSSSQKRFLVTLDFQDGAEPALAIDLSDEPKIAESFTEHQSLALVVTKDRFYRRPAVAGETPPAQSLELQEFEGQALTRSVIRDGFIDLFETFTMFLLFFAVTFSIIGINIWNWIVSLISLKYRTPHTKHTKAEQRAVAAIALVPGFYLLILYALFPGSIPGFFLLLILLHIAYVRFGTKAVQAGFETKELK